MMDERGQSDLSVVPGKPPNKAEEPAAEAVEGRERAKGNSGRRDALRTPGRAGALSALDRVRQAAERDRKQRFTALLHHVYDIEHLRTAYHALKRDVAALRQEPGSESPGSRGTAPARGVPGEAGPESIHPEGRRAAAAARRSRAGRQTRPARGRRGPECDLRGRLPRVLVRVPAGAQSAPGVGCADGRDHDEEGELGARRRYPWVLRHPRPRVAGEVRRAPRGGPARRAAHPEMAERRRAGGGDADTERSGNGAGREHQPAAGQSLPALRVRSLGPTVEKEAGARRCGGRALRG